MAPPRLMIAVLGAAAIAVVGTVLLVTRSWMMLVGVMALHAGAAAVVAAHALRQAAREQEKPRPAARIEDELARRRAA